jgi:hypothetical protein
VTPGMADWDEAESRVHRGLNAGTQTYEEVVIFFRVGQAVRRPARSHELVLHVNHEQRGAASDYRKGRLSQPVGASGQCDDLIFQIHTLRHQTTPRRKGAYARRLWLSLWRRLGTLTFNINVVR